MLVSPDIHPLRRMTAERKTNDYRNGCAKSQGFCRKQSSRKINSRCFTRLSLN
jgi:hypothetical protein